MGTVRCAVVQWAQLSAARSFRPILCLPGMSVRRKATEMLRCAKMMGSANVTYMPRYMALVNSIY